MPAPFFVPGAYIEVDDLDDALELFPIPTGMVGRLLDTDIPINLRVFSLRRDVETSIRYLERFTFSPVERTPQRALALEELDRYLSHPYFTHITPSTIAIVIFDHLDVAFFNGRLRSYVCLEVRADVQAGALAQTQTYHALEAGKRVLISLGRSMDTLCRRLQRKQVMQTTIMVVLHEMAHAYLEIYTDPGESDAWPQVTPAFAGAGHTSAFCWILNILQNATIFAEWDIDMSHGGIYPTRCGQLRRAEMGACL